MGNAWIYKYYENTIVVKNGAAYFSWINTLDEGNIISLGGYCELYSR